MPDSTNPDFESTQILPCDAKGKYSKEQEDAYERRANRRLKHWVIKMAVSCVIFSIGVYLVTTVYAHLFLAKDLDSGAISGPMSSLLEIIKFLFQ